MDYHHVELLFDMIVEYYHNKPPPEEHDACGEWVKVRDGLQGAEHCIRVLTPEEFDEWHRCIEVPVQVGFGRQPVAFCNHEGVWWVIYADTEEGEVIARFEECFEGVANENDSIVGKSSAASSSDESTMEISRFFGIMISMPKDDLSSPHFCAVYGSEKAAFEVPLAGLLEGEMSPRALALVTEWAALHRKELTEAWEDRAAGQLPRKIEPLR